MPRIEKTVFISYRRANAPWALAISQNLTHHGFDVFFDFNGIASGDFESIILDNVHARAHFLVLLTPSALERCDQPGDWLRREIEEALAQKRNIVPLMLDGFDFSTPKIADQLTGKLVGLRPYNALKVPVEYFDEAMDRLRTRYLNISVDTVQHPAISLAATQAARQEQAAVNAAPQVTARELTAQGCFERGYTAADFDEQIHFYSEAIRLDPAFAAAFNNRGNTLLKMHAPDAAIKDFNEAIRISPILAETFINRGNAYQDKGEFDAAINDYNEAIRLKPDYAFAFNNRGLIHRDKSELEAAINDYDEAIRLKPDYAVAFYNRGNAYGAKGELDMATNDYSEAIRLKPDYAAVFYNRALVLREKKEFSKALFDLQRYLDLGGGELYGNIESVRQWIRELQSEL